MNPRSSHNRDAASFPLFVLCVGLGVFACLFPVQAAADDVCTDGVNVGNKQPLDAVVVRGEPFYERAGAGKTQDPTNDIGLCGAFRFAGDMPPFDQNTMTNKYAAPESIHRFMDNSVGMPRVDRNLTTSFDLSNYIDELGDNSYGDFITTADCRPETPPELVSWQGCKFPGVENSNLRLGFGTRFRGFIDVKSDWAGKKLHFGFYTDDIMGALIVSRKPKTGPKDRDFYYDWIISRGGVFGKPKWITTNSVTFPKPGLYAIDIVHGNYSGSGILEFGILMNDEYVDREHGPTDIGGRVSLDSDKCRFSLSRTGPGRFFQSVCGRFSAQAGTVAACDQCPDSHRDRPPLPTESYPTYPCMPGKFCNAAAVCSPCVEDHACGPKCQACGDAKPRCATDADDPCNASKASCCQCVSTQDCAAGQICDGCNCVSPPCCAGYFPVFPDKAKDPNFRLCSPCLSDADCQMKGLGSICDLKNARCTNTAPPTCVKDGLSVDEQCGPACNINCKTQTPDRPYCLNNQVCVACRRDADCPSGNFCLSGTCSNPCVDDRHCGASCQNCGVAVTMDPQNPTAEGKPTNKPYCKVDTINGQKVVATGACVQCREDKECATGQTCVDNRCTPDLPCSPACPNNEVCFGGKCVQCFTDAQCPCGHCIEGRCTDKCSSNQDCEGNQCCQKSTGLCVSGRCGGTAGGALCGCSMPGAGVSGASLLSSDPALPEPFEPGEPVANRSRSVALAAFAALLLGLAMRRRVRLSTSATTRWS